MATSAQTLTSMLTRGPPSMIKTPGPERGAVAPLTSRRSASRAPACVRRPERAEHERRAAGRSPSMSAEVHTFHSHSRTVPKSRSRLRVGCSRPRAVRSGPNLAPEGARGSASPFRAKAHCDRLERRHRSAGVRFHVWNCAPLATAGDQVTHAQPSQYAPTFRWNRPWRSISSCLGSRGRSM
jgi:hypothetical protein